MYYVDVFRLATYCVRLHEAEKIGKGTELIQSNGGGMILKVEAKSIPANAGTLHLVKTRNWKLYT